MPQVSHQTAVRRRMRTKAAIVIATARPFADRPRQCHHGSEDAASQVRDSWTPWKPSLNKCSNPSWPRCCRDVEHPLNTSRGEGVRGATRTTPTRLQKNSPVTEEVPVLSSAIHLVPFTCSDWPWDATCKRVLLANGSGQMVTKILFSGTLVSHRRVSLM